MTNSFRTAEYVSPKHPDKLCDQVADALLDAYLEKDPQSRVAIEVFGGHSHMQITGEVTSQAKVDYDKIVKRTIGEIELKTNISQQSTEIATGVDGGGA